MRGQIAKLARAWLLPAFLLFFPVPLWPQASAASPTPEHEFEAAMAARDRGDLDRAETLLSALHRTHPGNFAVDESLGLLLVSRDEVPRALPLLEAAVREQPSSDVAHANLGAALYRLHRNASALAEFQAAARINPANASTQQSLGRLYMETRDPDKAADAFLAGIKLTPDDGDLQLDCATALLAANRVTEARSILAGLTGADSSARAQSLLGEASEMEGKFQDAIEHFIGEFEPAVAQFPKSTRIRFGLGAAYYGGARYADAIPEFAELLQTDPNNSLYAKLLGMACTAPTDKEQPHCDALVAYAKAHPRDAVAATDAASMCLHAAPTNGQLGLARQLLTQALAADPKLPEAQYQMGLLRQDQGDWAGSIANLEAAVRLRPSFSQAHYRLGLACWRTGRREQGQAEMDLEKKYAKQEQEDEDTRLRQITTFVVNLRN